jgi:hypothetical protein
MKLYGMGILAVIALVRGLLAYSAVTSIQLAEKTALGD